MLLVAFENQQVNVFESSNGHYVDEFNFHDNVFDTGHPNEDGEIHENEGKQKGGKPEKNMLEEEELVKSGMSKLEVKAHKRKIQRERGEYKPEIPIMTPVIKSQTLEREGSKVGHGSYMKKTTNMSIDTDNLFGDQSM